MNCLCLGKPEINDDISQGKFEQPNNPKSESRDQEDTLKSSGQQSTYKINRLGESAQAVQIEQKKVLDNGQTQRASPTYEKSASVKNENGDSLHIQLAEILHVKVHEAKNLPAADSNGLSDPFVVLNYHGKKRTTSVIDNSLNPVWKGGKGEDFTWQVQRWRGIANYTLYINVFDDDAFGKDYLGEALIRLSDLASSPEPRWFDLVNKSGESIPGAQIKLSISWEGSVGINSLAPITTAANSELHYLSNEDLSKIKYLDVTVIEGSNLLAADSNGLSDPYVEIGFRSNKQKSSIRKRTLRPIWGNGAGEKFRFTIKPSKKDEDWRVRFRVYDDDPLGHDFLGSAVIDLRTIRQGDPVWVNLLNDTDSSDSKEVYEVIGKLRISVFLATSKHNVQQIERSATEYLYISVLRAENLLPTDGNSQADPYVTVRTNTCPKRTHKTETIENTTNPVWQSEAPISIEKMKDTEFLYLSVYDEDVGINDFMGAVTIPIKELKAGQILNETYSLKAEIHDNITSTRKKEKLKSGLEKLARSSDRDPSEEGAFGRITVQLGVGYVKRPSANLMFRPSWRTVIGQLKVEVCGALGLDDKDDYHVELSVEGRQESTFEVRAKRPAWNEIFVFEITEITTQLYLSLVRDEDKVLGSVQIPIRVLANQYNDRDLEIALELLPPEPKGESFAKPHPKHEHEDLKIELKVNFQLSQPYWQIYLIQDELDTPESDVEFDRVFTEIFIRSGALVDAILFPLTSTIRVVYFLSTWEVPEVNRLVLFIFFMTYLCFRWLLGLKFLHVWPILLWETVFLLGYVTKNVHYEKKIPLWDDLSPEVPLLRAGNSSSNPGKVSDGQIAQSRSKLDTFRISKGEERQLRAEFYQYQYVALQKIKVIKDRVFQHVRSTIEFQSQENSEEENPSSNDNAENGLESVSKRNEYSEQENFERVVTFVNSEITIEDQVPNNVQAHTKKKEKSDDGRRKQGIFHGFRNLVRKHPDNNSEENASSSEHGASSKQVAPNIDPDDVKIKNFGIFAMLKAVLLVRKQLRELIQFFAGWTRKLERTLNMFIWTDELITFEVMILSGVMILVLTLVWNFLIIFKSLLNFVYVFGFLEIFLAFGLFMNLPISSILEQCIAMYVDYYLINLPIPLTPVLSGSFQIIADNLHKQVHSTAEKVLELKLAQERQLREERKQAKLLATAEGLRAFRRQGFKDPWIWLHRLHDRAYGAREFQSDRMFIQNLKKSNL